MAFSAKMPEALSDEQIYDSKAEDGLFDGFKLTFGDDKKENTDNNDSEHSVAIVVIIIILLMIAAFILIWVLRGKRERFS